MTSNQKKILNYSYDLLAKRRYSINQMIKKLDSYNQKLIEPVSESILQEILESLIKANFLNDKQFSEFYIDSQVRRKPVGKLKLKQQLQLKGIPLAIINQAFNTADLNETELAKTALSKKINLLKPDKSAKIDLATRQKLFRFLQSRGFASEAVFQAINQYAFKSHHSSEHLIEE